MDSNEWFPFDSRPRDGSQFLVWNGKEMAILNAPYGCAIGQWTKRKGAWTGAAVRFDNPTHWKKKPTPPKKLKGD